VTLPTSATTHHRSERSVIAYLAFLGVLLATGIDIALPAYDAIEANVGGVTNVPLIITAYLIGMALGQFVYGPISDSIGRVPAILFGLVLYAVGAVISALVPTFTALLAARFLWGLGAAAPAGLRHAIARDLYRGDAMARIVTVMMAVFLLGPVFVPLLGEFFIRTLPWQSVFVFPALLAFVAALWCLRFGETLDPEARQPLRFGQLGHGMRAIAREPVTARLLIGNVFLSGGFFIFLGSAQPVFDQVYDRASQFAFFFALTGLVAIPALLVNDRMLARFGARLVVLWTGGIAAVVAALGAAVTLTADAPSFWLWYVWLTITAGLLTLSTPALLALALDPMGELAGTASSLIYGSGFALGAALAAIFDAMVEDSVAPFVYGFALYIVIGYVFVWLATTGSSRAGRA